MTIDPIPKPTPRPLEALLDGVPPLFPAVRLTELRADAVVLSRHDRSADVVTEDGFTRTVFVGDPAEPIGDPAREAAVLRRALRSVQAQATTAQRQLSEAATEHSGQLARIRAYAIAKHRSGDICRSGLDEFLEEFGLTVYEPHLRVHFTITGSYRVTGEDTGEARRDAEGYLGVDLSRLDNVVDDSEDVSVSVDDVEALDDDER